MLTRWMIFAFLLLTETVCLCRIYRDARGTDDFGAAIFFYFLLIAFLLLDAGVGYWAWKY